MELGPRNAKSATGRNLALGKALFEVMRLNLLVQFDWIKRSGPFVDFDFDQSLIGRARICNLGASGPLPFWCARNVPRTLPCLSTRT